MSPERKGNSSGVGVEEELIKGSTEAASHSGDHQLGLSSLNSDLIQHLSAPKI